MGCVSSKYDRSHPQPNIFHVENVNDTGQALSPGQLEVTDSELIYHQHRGSTGGSPITTHWQLCYLRKYGFDSEIFSFECGRRCPTGEGIYAFRCKKAESLFNMLQHSIQIGNLTDDRRMTNNTGTAATPGDYPIPIASNGPPVPNRPGTGGPQPLDSNGYLNPIGGICTGSIRTHTVRPDSVTSNGGAGGPNSPVTPLDTIGTSSIIEWNNNKRGSLSGATQQQANGYCNSQVVMEQQQQQVAAQVAAYGTPTYINLIPTASAASATPNPSLNNNAVSLSNAPTVPCTPTPFDNTYANISSNNAYMNILCPPQTPGPHDKHTLAALMMSPTAGKNLDLGCTDDRQHCYSNFMEPSGSPTSSLTIWRDPTGSIPSTPTVVSNYAELILSSSRSNAFMPQVTPIICSSVNSSITVPSSQSPSYTSTNLPTTQHLSAPDHHDTSAAKPYVTIDWQATTALSQTANQQLVDADKGSRKTRHNSTIGNLLPVARQSSSQSD